MCDYKQRGQIKRVLCKKEQVEILLGKTTELYHMKLARISYKWPRKVSFIGLKLINVLQGVTEYEPLRKPRTG